MRYSCENSCEIACFLDLWTAGDVDFTSESAAENVCQGRFSQSWRATEEDMIEGVAALLGSLNHQHEAFFDLVLAAEFLEIWRSEAVFEFAGRCVVRLRL